MEALNRFTNKIMLSLYSSIVNVTLLSTKHKKIDLKETYPSFYLNGGFYVLMKDENIKENELLSIVDRNIIVSSCASILGDISLENNKEIKKRFLEIFKEEDLNSYRVIRLNLLQGKLKYNSCEYQIDFRLR